MLCPCGNQLWVLVHSNTEVNAAWQPLDVSAALTVFNKVAEAKACCHGNTDIARDAHSLIIHKGVPWAGFPGNEDL